MIFYKKPSIRLSPVFEFGSLNKETQQCSASYQLLLEAVVMTSRSAFLPVWQPMSVLSNREKSLEHIHQTYCSSPPAGWRMPLTFFLKKAFPSDHVLLPQQEKPWVVHSTETWLLLVTWARCGSRYPEWWRFGCAPTILAQSWDARPASTARWQWNGAGHESEYEEDQLWRAAAERTAGPCLLLSAGHHAHHRTPSPAMAYQHSRLFVQLFAWEHAGVRRFDLIRLLTFLLLISKKMFFEGKYHFFPPIFIVSINPNKTIVW